MTCSPGATPMAGSPSWSDSTSSANTSAGQTERGRCPRASAGASNCHEMDASLVADAAAEQADRAAGGAD